MKNDRADIVVPVASSAVTSSRSCGKAASQKIRAVDLKPLNPWKQRGGRKTLITCSAEDLIVQKAFAVRPRDWLDLEGVVMRQGRKLNAEQIWRELRPLVELNEQPEILTKLQRILQDHLH